LITDDSKETKVFKNMQVFKTALEIIEDCPKCLERLKEKIND